MISPISSYSFNNRYIPCYTGAKIVHEIPVKRRRVLSENICQKIFTSIKEIFFEMFPKLDPEYNKII